MMATLTGLDNMLVAVACMLQADVNQHACCKHMHAAIHEPEVNT